MEFLIEYYEIFSVLFLLLLGYFNGQRVEKAHFRSLEQREEETLHLPAVNFKHGWDPEKVKSAELVTGSVVVSQDYFKRMLAGLRWILGGRVRSFETLIDRARREALLRLKSKAAGAQIIVNVRIETSSIGEEALARRTIGSVEAFAYGTALWLND